MLSFPTFLRSNDKEPNRKPTKSDTTYDRDLTKEQGIQTPYLADTPGVPTLPLRTITALKITGSNIIEQLWHSKSRVAILYCWHVCAGLMVYKPEIDKLIYDTEYRYHVEPLQ
jgi:hypothetical protein